MKNWLSKSAVTAAALSLSAGMAWAQTGGTVTMPLQSSLSVLQQAKMIGPHAPTSNIKLTIGLKLNNAEALKTFLKDVQNPQSSQYHNFLPPAQFTAQYGPTQAQVDAAVQFLKQNGITVKDVSSNRILIHTQAPTGAYERALGIRINDYTLDGRRFYSTPDRPKLPSAVASVVSGILGLNHGVRLYPQHHRAPPRPGVKTVWPRQAPPPATTGSYLNQQQFAKAYDWPSVTDPNNGAGETIAILSFESAGLQASDYRTYWSGMGVPSHTVTVVNVDGSPGSGGEDETTLDIEYSGFMAPGADIILYEGAEAYNSTFTDVFNALATDDVADVASISWGGCDSTWPNIQTTEEAIMQGVAEGISVSAASGDWGASNYPVCTSGSSNALYPASSPEILDANGTNLTLADKSGTYGSETAWFDTGGGDSHVFDQPDWQTGPGVPNSGDRMTGDMAMHGGGRTLVFYFDGAWQTGFVGTSFVSPELAGLFAVADGLNGGRLGQSNELIYADVNAGNYASDFRDVTTGSNGHPATKNWDYPTGWGSPLATSLLAHLTGGGNACPAGYSEYDGSLAAGKYTHSPIYTAPAGEENAILTAETGFRLFAGTEINGQRKIYRIPGNEVHRQAPAGRYTWIVKAGDTSGTYTLCVNHP